MPFLKRSRKTQANADNEVLALNQDIIEQMIMLAVQTGDAAPLKRTIRSMHLAKVNHSIATTPRASAEMTKSIADTLLKVGRTYDDFDALEHAKIAYRDAITLASMLGDQVLRKSIKKNYTHLLDLMSDFEGGRDYRGAAA